MYVPILCIRLCLKKRYPISSTELSYSIIFHYIFHHSISHSIIVHHFPSNFHQFSIKFPSNFHHIPSHSIICRRTPSDSIIFHDVPWHSIRISSYFIIFHHISSYSIIFHHIPYPQLSLNYKVSRLSVGCAPKALGPEIVFHCIVDLGALTIVDLIILDAPYKTSTSRPIYI